MTSLNKVSIDELDINPCVNLLGPSYNTSFTMAPTKFYRIDVASAWNLAVIKLEIDDKSRKMTKSHKMEMNFVN